MSRLARLVAILVLFALFPGTQELVEQAGHWATAGHSAHAASHDEGGASETNDEHGCSAAMHVCHCCHVPGNLASRLTLFPIESDQSLGTAALGHAQSGSPELPFRPPLA